MLVKGANGIDWCMSNLVNGQVNMNKIFIKFYAVQGIMLGQKSDIEIKKYTQYHFLMHEMQNVFF